MLLCTKTKSSFVTLMGGAVIIFGAAINNARDKSEHPSPDGPQMVDSSLAESRFAETSQIEPGRAERGRAEPGQAAPGGASPEPAAQTFAQPDIELETLDRVITGLYEVISGPAGQPRDWDRFGSMFTDDAMMSYTQPTPEGYRLTKITPDEYRMNIGPNLERLGFTEKETHRVLERFGSIAHAFSTYHGTASERPGFVVEGINSIQLVKVGTPDGPRWKVHSIAWHQKGPDEDIPAEYLPEDEGGGGVDGEL